MTDFYNRSNFANERNAAAQARDEARRAKAEADRADSNRRAEDRRKDREEKADSRLVHDKEQNKPDNSARSDSRAALWKSESYVKTMAPSFARDMHSTKDFPFALYPGQDGRTCVFYGELIHHKDKTRFEKIHLSAMGQECGEFNTFNNQDPIPSPTIHAPRNLKREYGGLRETEFNWRGAFYLYWETDIDNEVTLCEIRGPSSPDSIDFPELPFSLLRTFPEPPIGGKYFVRIGSVDEDGNVSQELASDYHWCPSVAFPIGERTIYIPHGGDLDLLIKTFDLEYEYATADVTITIPVISVGINDEGHTHPISIDAADVHSHDILATTSSDGSHTHPVTVESSGTHNHSFGATTSVDSGHSHTVSSSTDGDGDHSHAASTTSDGAHTHTVTSTVSEGGDHTHTGSATNSTTGITATVSIGGETQGTEGTEVTGTVTYSKAKLVASTEMGTVLCWRNGDFVGSFIEGAQLPEGTIPVSQTIYVWGGA